MKKQKAPAPKAPPHRERQKVVKGGASWHRYALGGIALLVFVIYANSLHNPILNFDDNEYFQKYPEVLKLSWASIVKYFSGYYVIMYQPLPVFTFAVNYHFSGFDTFPMHLFNLLLHIANVVLVYFFISSLVRNKNIAIMVALLFGIHPMNVEAVTWISARSSSMYTFFYLAALIAYIRYIDTQKLKWIVITGMFFIVSLFSKAQAVTLPVVLLLLDYFRNRNLKQAGVWLEKIPFFALSVTFGLITLADSDTLHNITKGMMISYSPLDMVFLVSYSFSFYFFKLLLPVNLCAVYVYPPKINGMLPWEYYASILVLGALVYALYRFRHNKNVILCAGLFLITIAINIQIIPSRLFIVTERYGYFPYIGLYLLPLLVVENLRKTKPGWMNKYQGTLTGVLVVYVLFFSVAVYLRNQVWSSNIAFMTDIIEKNPEVPYLYRAYGNRALAYRTNNQVPEAIADFTSALRIKPNDAQSYYNRGLAYANSNNYKAALTDLNKAGEFDTTQSVIFRDRAQIRLMVADTSGAIADASKLLQLDPGNSDAYNVLATVAFSRQEYQQCESYLTEAIKYHPDFAIGIRNRGQLYIQMNRRADACTDFITASNLGNMEAKQLYTQYCK